MRRLMMALALAALTYVGVPTESEAADGQSVCESYCLAAAAGCYITIGPYVGKDKCDSLYEGCVEGCRAALEVEE